MIAEGGHGRRRHGVDGMRTDEVLHVKDVPVFRVLGAGRSPKHPLDLGAFGRQSLEARARKEALEFLIRPLGVGNGRAASQCFEFLALLIAFCSLNFRADFLVRQRINSADKETCDGGDAVHRLPLSRPRFERRQVRFRHFDVTLHGE